MKIIFGLGNPESQFNNTPHNVGFATVDKLCKELGGTFKKKKMDALISENLVNSEKVILAKPTTYMNNSGESVKKFIKKFKIPLKNVLIILDDIDLKAGNVRFREHGSAGTHNGLRNIVDMLGTQEFARLRVGVDKPDENVDLADFVLTKMSEEKQKLVNQGIDLAIQKALEFINE